MNNGRLPGEREDAPSSSSSPVKNRFLDTLFTLALVLIGWGRIEIELASPIIVSLGGTSRALVFIVFIAYLVVRARKADVMGCPSSAPSPW